MRVKVAALFSITLLTFGAAAVVPTASAAQGDCASGYTCLWEHKGYEGGAVSFSRYIPDLSQWHLTNGKKANDVGSSVKEHGSYEDACLFKNAYGSGESRRVGRGAEWYDLSAHSFNDVISSGYFTGFKSC